MDDNRNGLDMMYKRIIAEGVEKKDINSDEPGRAGAIQIAGHELGECGFSLSLNS